MSEIRYLRNVPELCEALIHLLWNAENADVDFTLEFTSRSNGDFALCRKHVAAMPESEILKSWGAWDTDYAILNTGVADDDTPDCSECERERVLGAVSHNGKLAYLAAIAHENREIVR